MSGKNFDTNIIGLASGRICGTTPPNAINEAILSFASLTRLLAHEIGYLLLRIIKLICCFICFTVCLYKPSFHF